MKQEDVEEKVNISLSRKKKGRITLIKKDAFPRVGF